MNDEDKVKRIMETVKLGNEGKHAEAASILVADLTEDFPERPSAFTFIMIASMLATFLKRDEMPKDFIRPVALIAEKQGKKFAERIEVICQNLESIRNLLENSKDEAKDAIIALLDDVITMFNLL